MKIVVESHQAGAADALAEFIRRKLERGLRPFEPTSPAWNYELEATGRPAARAPAADCRYKFAMLPRCGRRRSIPIFPWLSTAYANAPCPWLPGKWRARGLASLKVGPVACKRLATCGRPIL